MRVLHAPSGSASPVAEVPDLDTVYRTQAEQVARWVAHLGGPDTDVEDLVHEVFLIVQRRLPEFRGEAKLTSWLYQITLRVVRGARRTDRIRRWIRWARRSDVARALAPASVTPVDELERRQAIARVYAALDRLPEKYRTLMILFEIEELSGDEIAALTGIKRATVWVRLHRGRALFLDALDEVEGGRDG
jgi:RNA polymerase sigma-70 factor, ECF subfamily